MFRTAFAAAILVACALGQPVAGQTTFNGGDVFAPASWSNGLPAVGNNGTIATNGTFTGVFNFNQNTPGVVTVTHTAGTLSGSWPNFYNGPTDASSGWATFNWVQNGGTVTVNTLSPNLRIAYTLASGNLTTTNPTTAAIQTYNSGVFNQTGGTTTGFRYLLNDGGVGAKTHTLSGGTGVAVGGFSVGFPNTAVVDGSFTLTFNPTVPIGDIGSNGPFGTGVINFQDTWAGSWTRDHFTTGDWQEIFTKPGTRFEDEQITAATFSTIFEVSNAGAAGSTIRLAPVPEPASVLAVGALGLGVAAAARRVRAGRTPS